MKTGDKVRYTPRALEKDQPCTGIITHYMSCGDMFNQDMAVIDSVNHWVPVRDLVLCTPQNES